MTRAVNYTRLPTERPHPNSRSLDRLSVPQLLRLMNGEDARVPRAIARVIPQVARAVSLLVTTLRAGGRLFFLGAGTSGRLGVIEAAECPPTFSTPPAMIQAIIAGGRQAVFRSREGAEDDRQRAREEIRRRIHANDVVVGIAASGVTPFVEAGLRAAKRQGARTVLVTCHPQARAHCQLDGLIAPQIGPELITGSTRLKAGTATKLILNMLTVATLVQLGKVYGHWMVEVRPTSRKLNARAVRIIQELAGVSSRRAAHLLRQARGQTKLAIVMAARDIGHRQARRLLRRHDGSLTAILTRQPTRPDPDQT